MIVLPTVLDSVDTCILNAPSVLPTAHYTGGHALTDYINKIVIPNGLKIVSNGYTFYFIEILDLSKLYGNVRYYSYTETLASASQKPQGNVYHAIAAIKNSNALSAHKTVRFGNIPITYCILHVDSKEMYYQPFLSYI